MSMSLVFTQILVILLYVVIGFVAGKTKIINPEQRKYLTSLASNLILPFNILSVASKEISAEQMTHVGIAMALMFCIFGGTMVCSLLWHKKRGSTPAQRAAITSLITFPNCIFLGLPLCTALFGDTGILYSVAAILAFNVLFFTVQYSLFTGERFRLKSLMTPATIATVILLFMVVLGLRFPAPVQTVVTNTGNMITPLTLIIIGVMMSENNVVEVLKEKRAYLVMLLRNLVIPLVALVILKFLPMDASERLCVLVYVACPCATLTAVESIKNDMEPVLCARSILMSTLFFAATLPLMIALGQWVL